MKKEKYLYESVFRNYPDVVSVDQMSEMLGVSTKTAYRLLKLDAVQHFKIGRIYKIPKYNILAYLRLTDSKNNC